MKHERWLLQELPTLVAQDVIEAECASRLRGHYEKNVDDGRNWALLICGTLGVVLVGLGIILLVAYNWYGLSRPLRTAVSFALLLGAQALAGWVLWRRKDSLPWREGAATFLTLMVAASMALIHQTYAIPADGAAFLLICLLLSLPLTYLFETILTAVIYLGGTLFWAVQTPPINQRALFIWLLGALLVPYF
ncbi:MAG: DUF2157 domain-containing protein [Bacteroidota bacterium]